jgi:hypothetical protein
MDPIHQFQIADLFHVGQLGGRLQPRRHRLRAQRAADQE